MPENDRTTRASAGSPEIGPGVGHILPVAAATRFLQWGSLGLILPVSNLFRLSKGLSLGELGFSAALVSAVVILLEVPSGIQIGRAHV